MIWELAEQVLCNCTASILKSEEKSMGISCILPAGYHGVRSLSALVYGTPEELRPWLDSGGAHSLLVLAPPSAALPADWGVHPNVALVNTQEHLDICLAALHSAMAESTRIEAGHQRLLKLITASTPLTQLLNEVAGIYGHYADILDTALNILAFSNQIEPPEPSLPFEHAHGYIKPHVVRYLRDSGALREMSLPRPTRVLDPQRNTYAYSVPVRLTPMVKIGYLCVFTRADEMLSTTELFYLAQTAQLLSLEMQRDRFYTTNKAVYFTHLLNDLLQGVLPKSGSYEDRFSVFSYQLRQWKHIIVLRTGSELQPSININALSEQLQTLFGNSVYLIQDDYLIYLTSQADSASSRASISTSMTGCAYPTCSVRSRRKAPCTPSATRPSCGSLNGTVERSRATYWIPCAAFWRTISPLWTPARSCTSTATLSTTGWSAYRRSWAVSSATPWSSPRSS